MTKLDRAITVLDTARSVIDDRQEVYGAPGVNFARTAFIWTAILADKLRPDQSLSSIDVSLLMAGLKLSRLVETPEHLDSSIDLAGYAALLQEVA